MSDRVSTERKLTTLLEELRLSVQADVTENLEELAVENQKAASSILNYFAVCIGWFT